MATTTRALSPCSRHGQHQAEKALVRNLTLEALSENQVLYNQGPTAKSSIVGDMLH
jgi:hypothetical protein